MTIIFKYWISGLVGCTFGCVFVLVSSFGLPKNVLKSNCSKLYSVQVGCYAQNHVCEHCTVCNDCSISSDGGDVVGLEKVCNLASSNRSPGTAFPICRNEQTTSLLTLTS